MAAKQPEGQVGLGAFLELTGQSIAEAQGQISPLDHPTQLVIGNVEVEVKVALATDPQGGVAIETISAADVRGGSIDPGVLSTLRINFIATAAELPAPGAVAGQKPQRDAAAVIKELSERSDVANLAGVLGQLSYEATYVPNTQRWLVAARDPKGRLVREAILPDDAKEKSGG